MIHRHIFDSRNFLELRPCDSPALSDLSRPERSFGFRSKSKIGSKTGRAALICVRLANAKLLASVTYRRRDRVWRDLPNFPTEKFLPGRSRCCEFVFSSPVVASSGTSCERLVKGRHFIFRNCTSCSRTPNSIGCNHNIKNDTTRAGV